MENQSKAPIYNYKTGEVITNAEDLPVPFEKRTSTDVFCTVLTSLFAITMLVIAIANINLPALQKMTYPADSQGRHCTLDNSNFNYLYFTSPTSPAKRLCLAKCPTGTEDKLQCWPTENLSCSANSNPQFEVVIYPSQPSATSLGLYCLPKDDLLRNKILESAHLQEMFDFVGNYKGIGISLLCGIGFGLLGILLFSVCAYAMTLISIFLGGLSCIGIAILLIITESELLAFYKALVYLFVGVLIFIGLMLLWGGCFRQTQIGYSVNYIVEAVSCFWSAPALILMSFLFAILLTGLITLCTFQVMAYWSTSEMVRTPENVYSRPHSPFAIIMTVICAVEFLWGLCFLKQTFNFIMSGVAVTWHFMGDISISVALERLFKYHWGSVVGGAFLLNILYPFDLIYDLFKPDPTVKGGIASCLCCCCERVLDLSRTEAMTLINLVGYPYCNASRLCQQIVYYSSYTSGSQSANRFVRLGGHLLLASMSTLIGWIYMNAHGKSSVLGLILCFIVNLFVLTFFVCLLKDIAEAIMFCDLVDNYLQDREQIHSAPVSIAPNSKLVSKKLFNEGYDVIRTQQREK